VAERAHQRTSHEDNDGDDLEEAHRILAMFDFGIHRGRNTLHHSHVGHE
jgi:hypothetical protein